LALQFLFYWMLYDFYGHSYTSIFETLTQNN
jgi:hypothetical protein